MNASSSLAPSCLPKYPTALFLRQVKRRALPSPRRIRHQIWQNIKNALETTHPTLIIRKEICGQIQFVQNVMQKHDVTMSGVQQTFQIINPRYSIRGSV